MDAGSVTRSYHERDSVSSMPSNRFAQEQEQKRKVREARAEQLKANQHQLRCNTSAIKIQSVHRGKAARLLCKELRRALRPEEILEQRRKAWSSERAAVRKPGYAAGMLPHSLVDRERKRVWAMRSAAAGHSVAGEVPPDESQRSSSRTRSSVKLKSLSRRQRQLSVSFSMAHSSETPKASGSHAPEQASASSCSSASPVGVYYNAERLAPESPPTESRRSRMRKISKELMGAARDAFKMMLSA